ncbi:hypothetical protein KBC04_00015 [Candidatus Babeliales bacterium]|nr:hypothetical protein [Candidatus Babeliales bacterium]MBP9843522.1 hypothetical protein [Candidatus Babeliales bacterium]
MKFLRHLLLLSCFAMNMDLMPSSQNNTTLKRDEKKPKRKKRDRRTKTPIDTVTSKNIDNAEIILKPNSEDFTKKYEAPSEEQTKAAITLECMARQKSARQKTAIKKAESLQKDDDENFLQSITLGMKEEENEDEEVDLPARVANFLSFEIAMLEKDLISNPYDPEIEDKQKYDDFTQKITDLINKWEEILKSQKISPDLLKKAEPIAKEFNDNATTIQRTFRGFNACEKTKVDLPTNVVNFLSWNLAMCKSIISNPYDPYTGKKDDDDIDDDDIQDIADLKNTCEKILKSQKISPMFLKTIESYADQVNKGATNIQRIHRGRKSRQRTAIKKAESLQKDSDENFLITQAATNIQQAWRNRDQDIPIIPLNEETQFFLEQELQAFTAQNIFFGSLHEEHKQTQIKAIQSILDSQKISRANFAMVNNRKKSAIYNLSLEVREFLSSDQIKPFIQEDALNKILSSKSLTVTQALQIKQLMQANPWYNDSSQTHIDEADYKEQTKGSVLFDESSYEKIYSLFSNAHATMQSMRNAIFIKFPSWFLAKFSSMTAQEKLNLQEELTEKQNETVAKESDDKSAE